MRYCIFINSQSINKIKTHLERAIKAVRKHSANAFVFGTSKHQKYKTIITLQYFMPENKTALTYQNELGISETKYRNKATTKGLISNIRMVNKTSSHRILWY